MMKIKMLIIAILISYSIFAQERKAIINPKGTWYFGAEIGSNQIKSFEFGESANSLQAGLLAEYYFSKQWSVVGRVKYFKTGASFSSSNSKVLPNKTVYNFGRFSGEVLAVPVNLKWEFKIYKNFRGYLKIGTGISIETKSEYRDYSPEITENFENYFLHFNIGYGLTYFVNKENAIYLDFEAFVGGSKGQQDGIIIFGDGSKTLVNNIVNIGYKRNF